MDSGVHPVFLFPMVAVTRGVTQTGRSSGSRIILLARTFPLGCTKQWLLSGFRPRIQRRDRAGFSPASLLSLKSTCHVQTTRASHISQLLQLHHVLDE